MQPLIPIQKDNIQDIKVVLLGDVSVGKSSLMYRFVQDDFDQNIESTVGASFMTKIVDYEDKKIEYQIWDTAGQEKYKSLAPLYYKDGHAAIVVYDLTNGSTFDGLQTWFTELRELGPTNMTVVIVANKSDLVSQYSMDISKAYNFAKQQNCSLYFTSAKVGTGINDVFNKVGQLVSQKQTIRHRHQNSQSLLSSLHNQKRKKCCEI